MLIWLYVGQRVSDLLALKPSQLRFIENDVYIDINQQKTVLCDVCYFHIVVD